VITGLRAALLCRAVTQSPSGMVSLDSILPDRLPFGHRPTLETLALFLSVDFDGKGASGTVKIEAPRFSHRVPFVTPAGPTNSGIAVQFMLPAIEKSALVVSVVDGADRTKPFKAKWFIDFQDQAPFEPEKIDQVVALCNAETEKLLAALHGRAPERH
jgi:hypothetical protein